ncbi:nectin-3-like protein [Chanos chanos]|uniref:Nectin cell adhesion molecule 3 n=1 Tax=Chanos chanos TaxID=29144 RepID=A0A6J2VPG2_CHACN|nr:nectin-3-like protein [Chanos chanos]
MARRLQVDLGSVSIFHGLSTIFAVVLNLFTGLCSSEAQSPQTVSAVLGKNVTLTCKVNLEANLTLTQSSWERHLPSGAITVAVFNPEFGISIAEPYKHRAFFLNPSVHDASIVLQGVGFADIGLYTCKVSTFPLGNTQVSVTVDVMVEPKVYVTRGEMPLLDGGAEVVVATCAAERARPPAEVFWESEHLLGNVEKHKRDEPNSTTTTFARLTWAPTRLAQGLVVTCVVRHPALPTELHIPYVLDVQYAPDVMVVGNDMNWYLGYERGKLDCRTNANPPVHRFIWTRMDGPMPEGVEQVNGSLLFNRPLRLNDSGVYKCEAQNDVGLRSDDISIVVREPPPTTAVTTTSATLLPNIGFSSTVSNKRHAHFTSPTLASLSDSSLGTIVGVAVGGVLFLVFLLVLGGVCYMRQRRTFRGDYYTKQYIGPSNMQKESQLDVLQPHELQDVYGNDSGKGSQDLKPKPDGDIICPDYPNERKDREWGNSLRLHRDGGFYPEHHNLQNMNPNGPPIHLPTLDNGSPYLQEDCYDNETEGDYVSHMDGSVISRREWYV